MFPIMPAGSEFWNLDEIKSIRDKIVELVPTKSDSLVTFLYTYYVSFSNYKFCFVKYLVLT